MSTTLQTNELTLRTSIIQKINLIFNDEEYTFEAFILMKGNHILKKFVLYEGVPQRRNDTSVNFKKKLQLSIAESIRRKFADESAEYDHVDNIANNQNKFYVIPQTTDYSPFAAVCTTIQTCDSYQNFRRLSRIFAACCSSLWVALSGISSSFFAVRGR